ncbi:Isoquinoline 1-oxidoreductase subunit [Bradyrhizobium sp. CSA112]|uniref:Isoquinoline 1-oxidoreductase subunit n=1 Tax=Bradyrhizobium sp. CSA112 TaxID=2699170 RepID=UPI0023B17C89|nr:Isoquinoline 1-oxidoreductase subunit [Bradyrhizobium sp. CSA112]
MMRAQALLVAGAVAVTALVAAAVAQTTRQPTAKDLRPVPSFQNIADQQARSIALFEEAGKVLQHPRCVNCHPATERPLQSDAMRPHQPLVVRGADGHGVPGMTCNTCHHVANFDAARVPGHPQWHLAPASMAWEGRTLGEICAQIKDPNRNGGKDMAALLHHMAEDTLVGWGWSPGPGREPAPGTQAAFGALLRAWADTGAHCPPS